MDEIRNPDTISNSLLAYLGDSVMELLTRERIVETQSPRDAGEANAAARHYITAPAQSAAVGRLESHLTEAESDVYRRGRNQNGKYLPPHATAAEYRRATGLEVLFAYTYLKGDTARLRQLFDFAYPETENAPEEAGNGPGEAQRSAKGGENDGK